MRDDGVAFNGPTFEFLQRRVQTAVDTGVGVAAQQTSHQAAPSRSCRLAAGRLPLRAEGDGPVVEEL